MVDRAVKVALLVALVAYFTAGGMRGALIMGGTAYGAQLLA